MTPRRTAAAMIAAAVLLNVAFTGLGSVFDYPDVLKQPAGEVLASFRNSQAAVTAWFVALALGAALLAPVAVGVGRLSGSRPMRWAVPIGIAAAVVQVVGLLRWPLLVPGWAAAAAGDDPTAAAHARAAFSTADRVLGNLLGETGGYLLTAAWTALVLAALGTAFTGRWFVALGSGCGAPGPSGGFLPFAPPARRPRDPPVRPHPQLVGFRPGGGVPGGLGCGPHRGARPPARRFRPAGRCRR